MERRFDYANEHIDWSLINWSFGVFIDEFTVCSGDAGRLWVWRTNGTRYNAENIAIIQNTRRFSLIHRQVKLKLIYLIKKILIFLLVSVFMEWDHCFVSIVWI